MLLIAHELTLYTIVRRKSQFRSPLDIADEVLQSCPWYPRDVSRSLGKNGDRRIVGSINEMKRMMFCEYSPNDVDIIEKSLNEGLYSYLSAEKYGYGSPVEAVNQYKNSQMPWL
jgi:hypothetical protein